MFPLIELGIAQMVARYLGVVEAVGSNPATQTRKKHTFVYRDKCVLFSTKSADSGRNPPLVEEIASR